MNSTKGRYSYTSNAIEIRKEYEKMTLHRATLLKRNKDDLMLGSHYMIESRSPIELSCVPRDIQHTDCTLEFQFPKDVFDEMEVVYCRR